MNLLVLKDDDGIRPAGKPNECFYCKQKVGQPHNGDCVMLKRKVKVKYVFEIEIEVPHHWEKHNIEFNKNNGGWCATNALDELSEVAENNKDIFGSECICNIFNCEVVEIPDAKPYRKNKFGEIVD